MIVFAAGELAFAMGEGPASRSGTALIGGPILDPILDEEVLLRPSDTVMIQGTNHGWSRRSDAPCLIIAR